MGPLLDFPPLPFVPSREPSLPPDYIMNNLVIVLWHKVDYPDGIGSIDVKSAPPRPYVNLLSSIIFEFATLARERLPHGSACLSISFSSLPYSGKTVMEVAKERESSKTSIFGRVVALSSHHLFSLFNTEGVPFRSDTLEKLLMDTARYSPTKVGVTFCLEPSMTEGKLFTHLSKFAMLNQRPQTAPLMHVQLFPISMLPPNPPS